ncbi:hypothetical protein MIND_00614800 [Mycena indigotica]|uniref:HD domain-containing protein n=1 Tax=Mycena indigotica TaxID=2126181 RepID=A0A8H6W980_9AGAR|nr:uncharacterized protein MIND_00614800 [Mycena indigotica]KAF7303849.1 hypothetical protein MIND_00614800 [Mycena indigotica]
MSLATESHFLATIRTIDPHIDNSVVENMAANLQTRYSEPQRAYHTIEHVSFMLSALKTESTPPRGIIELAIWFHDCVYSPIKGSPWNEHESIHVWEEFVAETKSDEMIKLRAAVTSLIEATIDHAIPSSLPSPLETADVALLLDLDMSILGQPPSDYDRYAQGVRTEYAHYPDEEYRVGRTKVLQTFLARGKIFIGDGKEELETRARMNIQSEINRLKV